MHILSTVPFLALALLVGACSSSQSSSSEDTGASGTGEGVPIGLAADFSQARDVFGVTVVATASTPTAKVDHAAAVMAQYLDNDADGEADNPAVVAALVANQATLVMAATSAELEGLSEATYAALDARGALQDLYGDETAPVGAFDASLEEVHHLLLNYGWAVVFPDELAQAKGSEIADAMDVARGGYFETIPNAYPAGAWYSYDDATCDYVCMITEYTYWAHTSLLGAQEGRSREIGNEWRLGTVADMRATDTAATAILENGGLGLPTVLPDGNYQG